MAIAPRSIATAPHGEPRMPGGPIFETGGMTAVTSSRYSATGLLARSTNSSTSLSDGEGTLTSSTSDFPFASDSNRRGSYLVAKTDHRLGETSLII